MASPTSGLSALGRLVVLTKLREDYRTLIAAPEILQPGPGSDLVLGLRTLESDLNQT